MLKGFNDCEILVGATVVYPGRSGSSLWMNKGVVVGIYEPHPGDPDAYDRDRPHIEVLRECQRYVWREQKDPFDKPSGYETFKRVFKVYNIYNVAVV